MHCGYHPNRLAGKLSLFSFFLFFFCNPKRLQNSHIGGSVLGEQKSSTFSVFSSTRFLNTFFTRGEIKVHIGKTCATLPSFRLVSHAPAFSALPKLFPNCFLFIYLKTFAVKCCSFGFLLCCELFFPPFQTVLLFSGSNSAFQTVWPFFRAAQNGLPIP